MKKLIRNLRDPAAQQYWAATIAIARIVNELPAWQRGGLVVSGVDPQQPATTSDPPRSKSRP